MFHSKEHERVNYCLTHCFRHDDMNVTKKDSSSEGFPEVPDVIEDIACLLGPQRFTDLQILQVKMRRLDIEHLRY